LKENYFKFDEYFEGKAQQGVLLVGAKSAQNQHVLKCWRKLRRARVLEKSGEELSKCGLTQRKECFAEPERDQDSGGRLMQGMHWATS
jgi:hypothetical protein